MLSEKTDNTNSVKGAGIIDEGTSLGRVAIPQYAPGRHRETGKERNCHPPYHSNNNPTETSNLIQKHPKNKTNKFYQWKVGQINVQSASDDFRLNEILGECNNANLDIICMQEVRRLGQNSLCHLGYDFYWTGLKIRREQGVGIAIRQSKHIIVDGVIHHSPRLMAADLTISGCKIRMISAYAPQEDKPLSSKHEFYRELKKLCQPPSPYKVSINGDFNATTTIASRLSRFDGKINRVYDEGDTSNENGELFLDFCAEKHLSIANTWFDHPQKHRITWHSPDQRTKKVIDYSVCESWLRQYISDVRVRNSYFNSDHRLLVTKLKTPANKAARYFTRRKPYKSPRSDLGALKIQKYKELFINTLALSLPSKENIAVNIDEQHSQIVTSLKSARETLPKTLKGNIAFPWDNDLQLQNLLSQRCTLKRNKTQSLKERLKHLNRKIRSAVRKLKNSYYSKVGAEINEAKENRKYIELWRKAKSQERIISKKAKPIKCPGLKNHFQSHFNPNHSNLNIPNEIQEIPSYIRNLLDHYQHIDNTIPSAYDIKEAVKKLKANKSSLDIEGEIIKAAIDSEQFLEFFTQYITRIWQNKEIPTQWVITRISAIWKQKGSPLDKTKYRGISLGSIIVKIVMNIILTRTSNFYERQLLTTQFGFRTGKGCNDGIYMCKQLQEIAHRSNRKLYTCFVDLSNAYDHINRNLLFTSIRNRIPPDQPTDCIDIIESLYKSTKCYMSDGDPDSDLFETTSGVRQGGNESPNLFNLYIDYALREFRERCDAAGLVGLNIDFLIPNESTNREQRSKAPSRGTCNESDSGYADDLGVHAWSEDELNKMMKILSDVFTEFGLQINIEKTETMIWNWRETPECPYPENIISLNDIPIKNVRSFKYLGVWLSFDEIHIGEREVNYRRNCAKGAFAEHRKMLTNRNIQLQTRINFLNGLVRTRLTYGSHAWRPKVSELSKLSSTYNHFLRSMIYNGFKRINPPPLETKISIDTSDQDIPVDPELVDWRFKINNKQLYEITKTKPIESFFEEQQSKWISHITRRENNDITKMLTFHTAKGKKGAPTKSILERSIHYSGLDRSQFLRDCFNRKIRF